MVIQSQIQDRLNSSFQPIHLDVINESHMHSVPPGSESHFKVVIVSGEFSGKRAIQRHQAVYAAMGDLMRQIHALALHTYTPEEWAAREQSAPDSPQCHGGSKN